MAPYFNFINQPKFTGGMRLAIVHVSSGKYFENYSLVGSTFLDLLNSIDGLVERLRTRVMVTRLAELVLKQYRCH